LDVVAPSLCAACGAVAPGRWCATCRPTLGRRGAGELGLVCARCGASTTGERCTEDHAPLRGLAWHVAPWAYAGAGGAVVRRAKFDGDATAMRCMARALGDALSAKLRRDGPRRVVLVPVPVHRSRRAERGFDQAERLVHALVQALDRGRGRPRAAWRGEVARALVRVRATRPQGDPRVTDRAANVAGAFAVRRFASWDRRVAVLIDDVLTSGHTLRECARVLRASGVRTVAAATVARS